jgi:hypothetical protein
MTELYVKEIYNPDVQTCRSQWSSGLRHELSSPTQTLRSWTRIPLEERMSVYVYYISVLLCAFRRTDPPDQGVLPTMCRTENRKIATKVQQWAAQPLIIVIIIIIRGNRLFNCVIFLFNTVDSICFIWMEVFKLKLISHISVAQLGRLVVGFPWRRSRIEPGPDHVGFVVDKVELRQVFSKLLRFPLPIIPPSAPHSLFIIQGWYRTC